MIAASTTHCSIARSSTATEHRQKTDLGDLPADWSVGAIGDSRPFVTSGSRGWARYYSDVGDPFIRIGNLSHDWVDVSLDDLQHVHLDAAAAVEATRTCLRRGDLLISITADIGAIGFVHDRVPLPAYINQHIALVRFDPASVNSRFAAYVLASRAVQRLFKASMDVGAKAGMSLITVRKIRMPLPPVPEQDAIAAALSDVDGLIASLDRLIAKKRAIKQAAMQQLLTGKTRLPGFKGKWDAKPLRALADITMGQSPSSSFYNLRGDGLPLIQGNADIEDRRSIARVWTTQASKRCIAGDILLTVRAPVGAVGVASESACLGRGVCGLRPLADSSFLLQALVCAEPRWKILEQGSTFTSANRTQVGQFELRVPLDPSEQHAIAVVLDDMDADLRSLEVRAAKAKAIKQGMMQALLTGRVRLPVTAAAGGQA